MPFQAFRLFILLSYMQTMPPFILAFLIEEALVTALLHTKENTIKVLVQLDTAHHTKSPHTSGTYVHSCGGSDWH